MEISPYNVPQPSSLFAAEDKSPAETALSSMRAPARSGRNRRSLACRILVVEDQDSDFLLIDRMLKKFPDSRFSVTRADDFCGALELLSKRQFDAALVDYHIGVRSGLDLIRKLGGLSSRTPMILLTGCGDERIDIEALNAGAADYLDKSGLSSSLLERSIRYARVHHDLMRRLRTSNRLLERAMAQTKTANKAKSDFLASMSHELRTPLNAILGFSEVIKDELLGVVEPTGYRDYAEHIHDSGHYLLGMVDKILDLAKIEAGKFELSDDVIDLPQLIAEVISLVEIQARQGGVTLKLAVPCDLPRLRADSQAVMQMVLNLLSNALKFTPRHGLVTVAVHCQEKGICIAVTDSGIGIQPKDLGRVMMPFCQAGNLFKSSLGGTGLGLSIVKSQIELHGGRFKLQSEEGKGTIAALTFPAERTLPIGVVDELPRKKLSG